MMFFKLRKKYVYNSHLKQWKNMIKRIEKRNKQSRVKHEIYEILKYKDRIIMKLRENNKILMHTLENVTKEKEKLERMLKRLKEI